MVKTSTRTGHAAGVEKRGRLSYTFRDNEGYILAGLCYSPSTMAECSSQDRNTTPSIFLNPLITMARQVSPLSSHCPPCSQTRRVVVGSAIHSVPPVSVQLCHRLDNHPPSLQIAHQKSKRSHRTNLLRCLALICLHFLAN